MNNGITVISDSREIAPVVQRLRDEGLPADFYIHGKPYKNSFNGIVPKVSMEGLRKALKKNDTVFFDMVKTNEHTIDDYKLLKYFGLKTNLPSVFGPIADKLKKDHRVICGAEWADSIRTTSAEKTLNTLARVSLLFVLYCGFDKISCHRKLRVGLSISCSPITSQPFSG